MTGTRWKLRTPAGYHPVEYIPQAGQATSVSKIIITLNIYDHLQSTHRLPPWRWSYSGVHWLSEIFRLKLIFQRRFFFFFHGRDWGFPKDGDRTYSIRTDGGTVSLSPHSHNSPTFFHLHICSLWLNLVLDWAWSYTNNASKLVNFFSGFTSIVDGIKSRFFRCTPLYGSYFEFSIGGFFEGGRHNATNISPTFSPPRLCSPCISKVCYTTEAYSLTLKRWTIFSFWNCVHLEYLWLGAAPCSPRSCRRRVIIEVLSL